MRMNLMTMTMTMNEYVKILLVGLTCVLVIVCYGTYRCKNTQFVDPLTYSFAPAPLDKYLDGWGISHLLFFALLGFHFPTKLLFCFALGVVWEMVEYSMQSHPFYLSKCNYDMQTHKGEGWWYGRWQDIVMNTCGLWIGVRIHALWSMK